MDAKALAAVIDAVFERHMQAELAGDLDGTLATMSSDPHLVNVPTMVGGSGPAGVRQFYANRLVGQFFPLMRRRAGRSFMPPGDIRESLRIGGVCSSLELVDLQSCAARSERG